MHACMHVHDVHTNRCASFLYTTFGDAEGSMSAVDAIFPGGKSCIPLAQLSDLVDHAIDKRCVRLAAAAGLVTNYP